ncbi:MAG TPA: DUF2752 domain-containing protein [Pyrinomonadaceae bacterium]|nr:DUF2752 domain-containing protein [Pyrinomonadaceae bacterium]
MTRAFNRPLTIVAIWLLSIAAAVYLFIFEPGKSGFFLNCPFRMLTGFACPGCGSTRGLHRLLHGDIIGAFQFNPIMFLLLPILLYVLVRHTIAVFGDRPVRGNRVKPAYIWVFFAVVMSFWVFRNTPFYPFVS